MTGAAANRSARPLGTAVICLDLQETLVSEICRALEPADIRRIPAGNSDSLAKVLRDAEVAIVSSAPHVATVSAAAQLRSMHYGSAGIEQLAVPEILGRGIIVTGSAGRSAEALAEHVFFFLLALTYGAPTLVEINTRRVWPHPFDYAGRPSLCGQTIGLIGLGHTGMATARLAHAFGMRVVAWRRRHITPPTEIDRVYAADQGEELAPLLRESDAVVICVSLSNQTYHLVGEAELALMKPTAFLINVARGGVVDQAALVAALRDGRIAGAGLDVTHPEPPAPDDPIWRAPNTIITPHATPRTIDRDRKAAEIILVNIRRYRSGEPLLNQANPSDVFAAPNEPLRDAQRPRGVIRHI